jgi:hypothetical protein
VGFSNKTSADSLMQSYRQSTVYFNRPGTCCACGGTYHSDHDTSVGAHKMSRFKSIAADSDGLIVYIVIVFKHNLYMLSVEYCNQHVQPQLKGNE